MNEYIKKDDAIRVIKNWFDVIQLNPDILIDGIITLPPADVIERKRGEWIRIYSRPNVLKYLGWTCNQCEYRTAEGYAPQYFHFCPNCGADMRGDDNESD